MTAIELLSSSPPVPIVRSRNRRRLGDEIQHGAVATSRCPSSCTSSPPSPISPTNPPLLCVNPGTGATVMITRRSKVLFPFSGELEMTHNSNHHAATPLLDPCVKFRPSVTTATLLSSSTTELEPRQWQHLQSSNSDTSTSPTTASTPPSPLNPIPTSSSPSISTTTTDNLSGLLPSLSSSPISLTSTSAATSSLSTSPKTTTPASPSFLSRPLWQRALRFCDYVM